MRRLKRLLSMLLVGVIASVSLVCGSVTASAVGEKYYCFYDEIGKELQLNGTDVNSPVFAIAGISNDEEGNYFTNVRYSDSRVIVYRAKLLYGENEITFEYAYYESSKGYTVRAYDYQGNIISGLIKDYGADSEDYHTVRYMFVLNDKTPENKKIIQGISEATKATVTVGIIDTASGNEKYFLNYYKTDREVSVEVVNRSGRPYPYTEITAEEPEEETAQEETYKDISTLNFGKISAKSYTGKSITPAVAVKDGEYTLVPGTDYTISYKNNKEFGTASVIIKGMGRYTGTKTLSFNIVPKKTTLSAKKTDGGFKLSWSAVKGITKYQISYSSDGGKTYKKTSVAADKTSAVLKLDTGKTYVFKIRSYKTVNGKNYCSVWSKPVKV